jgi:hypothetical protein
MDIVHLIHMIQLPYDSLYYEKRCNHTDNWRAICNTYSCAEPLIQSIYTENFLDSIPVVDSNLEMKTVKIMCRYDDKLIEWNQVPKRLYIKYNPDNVQSKL